jgi:hypothetical protein
VTIHPVKKDSNRYCGPAVISAATGITTGEAAKMIRELTNVRAVMGTQIWQLERVFDELNYKLTKLSGYEKPRPTLARWLKLNKEIRTEGRVFLISAGRHWQLISGRRYVCGRTIEIVSVRDKRVARRARVKGVWEIIRRAS